MQIQTEDSIDSVEELFQRTGEYLETRVDLVKLKAIDKSSDVISSLAASIVMILVFLLFILSVNIGVAIWIGDSLGKTFYGFFIVAGFYAIVGLILFLVKDKWIKGPVSKLIIEKVIK
jgi:hypothetical protein